MLQEFIKNSDKLSEDETDKIVQNVSKLIDNDAMVNPALLI